MRAIAWICAINLLFALAPAEASQARYCTALRNVASKVTVEMRKGAPLEAAIAWAEREDREVKKYVNDAPSVLRPLVYYVYQFQTSSQTTPIEIGALVHAQCENGSYGHIKEAPQAASPGRSATPPRDRSAESAEGVSMGTGWPVAEGFVVTNNHVIAGRTEVALVKTDGSRIPATIYLTDAEHDLALLQPVDTAQLPPALVVSESDASLGAQVFTIGYPHPDIMGSAPKLTTGVVNALSGLQDDRRTYQISVALQSGNSGGPLVNMRGQVVGVVTSKLSAVQVFRWTGDLPQNVNYAMKSRYLVDLIRQANADMIMDEVPAGAANLEELAARISGSVMIVVAR
jgi:S1-C subfamily serine protease